jgi:Na+:H+ antiporter, NhaA family
MKRKSRTKTGDGVNYAPWERAFGRILTPFEEFIHRQTTSGLMLMSTALLALVVANSGLAPVYQHYLHQTAAIEIGGWSLRMSLHHWVNDGLMALFFFVVGMELKREMLVGELAQPRHAALPIVAALGGMLVPAAIYLLWNPSGDAARGWGIPMATDIAFAVGALVLLASRVPQTLITFLVALAIVDDLGAVLVIALFYTQELAYGWLAVALAWLAMLMLFNRAGVRRVMPYFIVAVLLWYALLQSGLHATLAGVLGAFTVPARPRYDPSAFSAHVKRLLNRFDSSHARDSDILTNDELRTVVQALENGVVGVQAPLQRLEYIWHMPVAFLVIPIFALFNAGIPIEIGALWTTLSHPVTLGVGAGLVLGKVIGITAAAALALRLGIASLPAGTRFAHIAAVSLLGGIGFTMSIFIAELAFAAHPEALLMAKTGVLSASVISGLGGYAWLWWLARSKASVKQAPAP